MAMITRGAIKVAVADTTGDMRVHLTKRDVSAFAVEESAVTEILDKLPQTLNKTKKTIKWLSLV